MILFDTSVLSRVFRRRRPGAEERRLQFVFEELMASDVPLGLPGIVLQPADVVVDDDEQRRTITGSTSGLVAGSADLANHSVGGSATLR